MQKNMVQPSEGGQLSETIDLTEKPTRGDNIKSTVDLVASAGYPT